MKKIISFILILFLSSISSPSWSETLTIDDLVERNDLYYKKFTNTPFTGEISGLENGKFKKGKRVGEWVEYWENGQLKVKGTFKDGKPKDGPWESYHKNGQLREKGNIKDGKQDGLWEWYFEDGQIDHKRNFKDGKPDGLWEYFNKDGSLNRTETWKDGVKQE